MTGDGVRTITVEISDGGRMVGKAVVSASSPRSGVALVAAMDETVSWVIPLPSHPVDDLIDAAEDGNG